MRVGQGQGVALKLRGGAPRPDIHRITIYLTRRAKFFSGGLDFAEYPDRLSLRVVVAWTNPTATRPVQGSNPVKPRPPQGAALAGLARP